MKPKRFVKKLLSVLLVVVLVLIAIPVSSLAKEPEGQKNSRGVINSTQISYINNAYSGCYLKYASGVLSTVNGSITQLGNTIRWTISPVNDGSNTYTIVSLNSPTRYLSSSDSANSTGVYSVTLSGTTIPDKCKWTISIGNGGCLIKNVHTGKYLCQSNGTLSLSSTVGSLGTVEYKQRIWRIAEAREYYGPDNTYQYVELPDEYSFKPLYMFSNQSRMPELSDEFGNVMWGGAENFTFSGYNTSYVTWNELTGEFTSTSLQSLYSGNITATHKVTGRTTVFNIVINPSAALVGVVDTEAHDHYTALTSVRTILHNIGYSNATPYSGEFTTANMDAFLTNNTNNIFVSRSHAGVTYSGESVYRTFLLLTKRSATNKVYYNSNGSITGLNLDNLKLALFIGCQSGAGGNGANNLPTVAVEQGARTAVGFSDPLNCDTSNRWTISFFNLLEDGYSVELACAYLAATEFQSTAMTSYVLCGRGDTTL